MDTEEVTALVATGREQGFLTFDAVADALAEVDISRDQVEELHTHLSEQGIDFHRDGTTHVWRRPR